MDSNGARARGVNAWMIFSHHERWLAGRFGQANGHARRSDRRRNFKTGNFRPQCAARKHRIQQRVQHRAVTEHASAFHQRKYLILHFQTAHINHRQVPQADRRREQNFLGRTCPRLLRPQPQ